MAERILYQFCGAGDMPGGVQDATNTVAQYVNEVGHEPHLFVGSTDDKKKTDDVFNSFDPEDIHILGGSNHYTVANGSQNPLGSFVTPKHIRSELSVVNPDLVHINAPWMPHIGGQVLREAQKELIPTVATYHIVSEELTTNALLAASRLIDRKSIYRLDAMIAVSEPARKHMERTYKYNGDTFIIPNGVDVKRYEEAKPFEADEPYPGFDPQNNKTIVFVGRPDPRKGLGELLSAFQLVHRDLKDTQLIACGGNETSLQPYKARAEHLGISDAVHFMGRVSEEDKARWFASADIAALPALHGESQGIVLLEGMAAGAGVVMGGDNEGYRSVLEQLPDNGLVIVEPNMTTYFANKMRYILETPVVADLLHEEQQKLVRRVYDSRVTGKQVLDVYQQVL